MTADELVELVERHTGRPGRRVGRNVRLICPAHDAHEPSLDVAAGDDGRPLVRCRSRGCSYEQILEALGVTRDAGDFEPERVYVYVDEHGRPLFEVGRFPGKRFLQRLPGADGWKGGIGDARRVLYRLP